MEAKDTVVDYNIACDCIGHCHRCQEKIAKDQAEVSFDKGKQIGFEIGIEQGKKAGMEEESTQAYHAGLHDGILRGRKEVVDFLNKDKKGRLAKDFWEEEWPVQLENWGLE